MYILLIILLVIVGLIALILLFAFFTRKDYTIYSEIVINAPVQKVYEYLKHIKNQDYYNKWVMADPNMKKEFKGTDGTVGFVYAWDSKKGGAGEQEIKVLTEGKSVETEIRFIRPFTGVGQFIMTTTAVSDNQTKVTWSNASKMKYPLNAMISMIEKMLTKDINTSLGYLKGELEK